MTDNKEIDIEGFNNYRFQAKLKKLLLKDFRGFPSIELNFDNHLTVLIGNNGGGKTTILDAIAEFLNFLVRVAILKANKIAKYIPENDEEDDLLKQELLKNELAKQIKKYRKKWSTLSGRDVNNASIAPALCDLFIEVSYTKIIETNENVGHESSIVDNSESRNILQEEIVETGLMHLRFEINKDADEVDFSIVENDNNNTITLDDISYDTIFFESVIKSISSFSSGDSMPIFAYYGGSSVNVKLDDYKRPKTVSTLQAIYNRALDKRRFSFRQFYEFYNDHLKRDLQKYEQRLEEGQQNNKYINKKFQFSLERINQAIEQILNDGKEIKYKGFKIEYSKFGERMVLAKKAGNTFDKVGLLQLSSGEENMIALVSDIAMRLTLANEGNTKMSNPLEGQGIVLIDEIDLHFHPKWQRRIVPFLREIFPNVQFVISTHSPLVLQNVDDTIIVLKEGKAISTALLSGWTIEDIFIFMGLERETLFGKNYLEALHNFYESCNNQNIEKADEFYEKLMLYLSKDNSFRIILRNKLENLKEIW